MSKQHFTTVIAAWADFTSPSPPTPLIPRGTPPTAPAGESDDDSGDDSAEGSGHELATRGVEMTERAALGCNATPTSERRRPSSECCDPPSGQRSQSVPGKPQQPRRQQPQTAKRTPPSMLCSASSTAMFECTRWQGARVSCCSAASVGRRLVSAVDLPPTSVSAQAGPATRT